MGEAARCWHQSRDLDSDATNSRCWDFVAAVRVGWTQVESVCAGWKQGVDVQTGLGDEEVELTGWRAVGWRLDVA